jgi:MFS family permease
MVEGLGVSQIFALVPSYLRQMGVPQDERLAFVGLFSALIFVVGMPLVPLWGVWADKYSRKAVIVRSALIEAVVFAGVALSTEPWQLAVSMLLIGFQLGNTGVMLAGIRDVTPRARLGTVMGIFGASTAVGMAAGPALAGVLIDGFGWSLPMVFWLSSGLSIGTALLVTFGSREVRPSVVPEGRVLTLAFGALRSVLSDAAVRRIFLIFGVSFLANQMSRPYVPVVVEGVAGTGPGLASAIGLVMGTAALVGGLMAPLGGWLGDRLGFRHVLVGALALGWDRARVDAIRADCRDPRSTRRRDGGGDLHGERDGLRPALDRGPSRPALVDPQPRLPAALCGWDHRAGTRRGGRRGRWDPGSVPARLRGVLHREPW